MSAETEVKTTPEAQFFNLDSPLLAQGRFDNHVANIDTHPESNALVFRVIDCKFLDAGLE